MHCGRLFSFSRKNGQEVVVSNSSFIAYNEREHVTQGVGMEVLRIGDNKLKVTLTGDDMAQYRLQCDTMDYDTTETRRAFWQILDEAKHKTGFDAGSGKIFVQVYASRDGGCEMFVTRVGEEAEDMGCSQATRREGIYVFTKLTYLLDVCGALAELGYNAPSSAYLAGGEYYLLIRERDCAGGLGSRAISEYGFIEEYGTRLFGGVRLAYLREHGSPIVEGDAVEQLAALA